MEKVIKPVLFFFIATFLLCCFLFTSRSFSQEMPKPGMVIDKSNYKEYLHLFYPEELFKDGFENGWGGIFLPLSIQVSETKPGGVAKKFVALSEKNRGKYSIDKDGFITGGFDYVGLPFPGLTPSDKDFSTKLMYNYNYRYFYESINTPPDAAYMKRRGESTTWNSKKVVSLYTVNRLYDDPKPTWNNPSDFQYCLLFQYVEPTDIADVMVLTQRFNGPKKPDNTYTYIPALRRVLRGDAGQRSTPLQGLPYAPDDLNGGFDGKTFQFNYKFLGERKLLISTESNVNSAAARKEYAQHPYPPFPGNNWSVRDTYLVEITSKDPRYPQSKKILVLDKESLMAQRAVIYDRAGKLWKIIIAPNRRVILPDGDNYISFAGQTSVDVQFGIGSSFWNDFFKSTGNNVKPSDFLPPALLRRATR